MDHIFLLNPTTIRENLYDSTNYLGERTPVNNKLETMDSTFALRLGLADKTD